MSKSPPYMPSGPLFNIRQMVSSILYQKLLKDGINGNTLLVTEDFTVQCEDGYLIQRKKHDDRTYDVWVPTCIDAKFWSRVLMDEFRPRWFLEKWIYSFFLPAIDNQMYFLTKYIGMDYLVEAFRQFGLCTKEGEPIKRIRRADGYSYYFNEEGILQQIPNEEVEQNEFVNLTIGAEQGVSANAWTKACTIFTPGATLKDCVKIFLETPVSRCKATQYTFMQRFIQRIIPPIFVEKKNADETPKDWFDELDTVSQEAEHKVPELEEILVTLNIGSFLDEEGKTIPTIKERRKEIDAMVAKAIITHPDYPKYNIPLRRLRVVELTLRRDHTLFYRVVPISETR